MFNPDLTAKTGAYTPLEAVRSGGFNGYDDLKIKRMLEVGWRQEMMESGPPDRPIALPF